MANVKKFDFNKSYEVLEIAGKEYEIEFNDEKMIDYNKSFDKFYQESKKIHEIDTSKLSIEEQEEMFKRMQNMTKNIIEKLLGEGSYEHLYEASGKSIIELIELIEYLGEVVEEKMQKIRNKKKNKYVMKKK